MPPLPARRNSLCLFCAFAARPTWQPPRLLPRIQIAHRVGSAKKRKLSEHGLARSANPVKIRDGIVDNGLQDIREALRAIRKELAQPDVLTKLQLTQQSFHDKWLSFERSISTLIKLAPPELMTLIDQAHRKKTALVSHLRYRFYEHLYSDRFTEAEKENQGEVANLRHPAEWYPATREVQRTVHMHVGPTNSGKTYHALKRLEEVDSGIYLGPLRLLAHEVYTRLNAKGKPCALITGEEQRMPEDTTAHMYSCTVEMAPLNTMFDVAVIDEIQMIGHEDRGWAWTQAFLGLKAREIHLCGEARTVPLMRELCALVGDKVHVHEYNRLTPLQAMPRSLNGDFKRLEKGDCIVAFSVLGIHAIRRDIERRTNKKCAIVYGGLPPEIRAHQARLFNDPDNEYDYLVASDAIGMGLNLAIKRVIFETTMKSDGSKFVPLQISEIKQIAGRAGRYKTAHQAITKDTEKVSVADGTVDPVIGLDDKKPDAQPVTKSEPETIGWATTLHGSDLAALKSGMANEPEEITAAGLFPPSLVVERFSSYFPPGTPFSYILLRLHQISNLHPRFRLCLLRDQLSIADNIDNIRNLSVQDRVTLCATPLGTRQVGQVRFLRELAQCIASKKSGSLLDLKTLPLSVLDEPPSKNREYLRGLEELHKMIVGYLWLSYRFPNVFTTRSLANYTKKLVEDQIEKTLAEFNFTREAMFRIRYARQQARKQMDTRGDASTNVADEPASKVRWTFGQAVHKQTRVAA